MSNIKTGKVFVAPNGYDKVRLYPHGFVEPVTEISEEHGELIKMGSAMAIEILGAQAKPEEIFTLMGWKEDKP